MRYSNFNSKIPGLPAAPDEKGVHLDRFFRGAFADDGLVFDAPELRIAVPALERLAVKDRIKARVIGNRQSSIPGPRP
jgi:hypothetical protein